MIQLENEIIPGKENDGKEQTKKKRLSRINGSQQQNTQDLDQEQKVVVRPEQYNSQNVYVLAEKQMMDTSIHGTAYFEKNREIVSKANILLFFGIESRFPVLKTCTDENGYYEINQLPPGYYSILADFKEMFKYKSHYIKLLLGERLEHNILLK